MKKQIMNDAIFASLSAFNSAKHPYLIYARQSGEQTRGVLRLFDQTPG